jgi:branched-chain amino acid transport system permease protein
MKRTLSDGRFAHNDVIRRLREAWFSSRTGPLFRLFVGFVSLRLAVWLVFPHDPPLGVLINGLVIGSLYALLAIGLILIYRASRIINFAQAAMGTIPAVLALVLYSYRHWPYPVVLLIVLVGSPLMGAFTEGATVRLFESAPRLIVTMVTIGLAQGYAFFELLIPLLARREKAARTVYGPSGVIGIHKQIITPFSRAKVRIGGVYFSGDHLVAVVVVVAACVALAAFFRYSNIGIAVRAAAENGDRARLLGIPVREVSSVVWMIAGLLSGLSIFVRAPIVGTPIGGVLLGPGLLLYALAAAVIARMESLPTALAAGLAIGVVDQATFYGTRNGTLSNAIMLPIILGALFLQRRAMSRAVDTGLSTWQTVKEFRPIPVQLNHVREVAVARLLGWLVVAGLLLGLPYMLGPLRYSKGSLILIYAIVGLSVVILTGWAGQISLGQWALSGMGAAVAGGLAANHGTDFVVTLFVAGLAGAAFSVAIGAPAARIPGLFLAVTSLAFAANLQYFFLDRHYFGWLLPRLDKGILRPVIYGRFDVSSDLAFYYVCLTVFALAVLVARSLRSSRSGRVFIASRDNGRAAQSFGVGLVRTRLAAFATAGFMAGIAGALYAYLQGAVDASAFTGTVSADLFIMAVIGGLTSISGPLVGAVYLVGVRDILPNFYASHYLAQGVGITLVLRFSSGGMIEVGYRLRDNFLRRIASRHSIVVPSLSRSEGPGAFGDVSGQAASDRRVPDVLSVQALAHTNTDDRPAAKIKKGRRS